MWRVFHRENTPHFSPQTTIISPRIHHKNTTQKHAVFQNPHQKTPAKPSKTVSRAPQIFPATLQKLTTEDSNNPARNTDWDMAEAEADIHTDSVAATAAVAAAIQLPDDSAPPETPS